MLQLGKCYEHGRGVTRDEAAAVRAYRRGASLGDADAQFNLGVCLGSGIGVPAPDFDGAFAMFEAAAAQGNVPALMNVAVSYVNGCGTAVDPVRAVALLRRAAALADAESLDPTTAGVIAFNLGHILLRGAPGVPRDAAEGARHLRLAVRSGHEAAARLLREAGLDEQERGADRSRIETGFSAGA